MDEYTIDSITAGTEAESAAVLINMVEENVTDVVMKSHIQNAISRLIDRIV